MRYTTEGKPVATLRIAHNEGDNEPLFINITAWEKLADACAERLRKGSKIVVHGKLKPESWTAGDGTKRNSISIRAVSIEFMAATQSPATTEGVPPRADSESEPEQTGLPF